MRGGGTSKPVIEQEILKQVQHDVNLPLKQNRIISLTRKGRGKISSRFTLHPSLKQRAAFTLAEVLITLGIIGIVAALTMPALIAKHQKKVYVTQFKKAYNTVTNAFKLMQAESGSDNLLDSDFITVLEARTNANEVEVTRLAKKYFNIVQDVKFYIYSTGPEYRFLFFGNGIPTVRPYGYLLKTVDGADIYLYVKDSIFIMIDVNGSNHAPNTIGRDFFYIHFTFEGKEHFNWENSLNYCGGSSLTTGDEPSACAQRVIQEGWEMNY